MIDLVQSLCSIHKSVIMLRNYDFENLVLATGHAMMGLSLAPATGELVRDVMDGRKVREDYERFFDPER